MKQYVDEGKVQMVFKHFAFLGPESQWAAVASECAADQGKFWEYHDKLYNSQQGENQGAFNKEKSDRVRGRIGAGCDYICGMRQR